MLAQGDPAQPLHWGCCPAHTAAVCSQNQGPLCSCSEQRELRGWALAALWSRVSSSPITPSSAPKSHPPPLGLDAAPQLRELPPAEDRRCCQQNPRRAPLLPVLAKGRVKSSMPRDPTERPQPSSPHQSTPVHSWVGGGDWGHWAEHTSQGESC